MSERIAWTRRTFSFDFPVELHHEILERLRGTPVRVEALVRDLPTDVLTRREQYKWSIQENVGHLADVENLFLGRLDDYDAGADTLRPADMSGQKTFAARYNEQALESVIENVRQARAQTVDRLEQLAEDRFGQSAMHPRLGQPMRIVDMMLFFAEHDDYHLARITELKRRLAGTLPRC
jgi:uncharacterized damage-inducible protein DinB